MGSGNQSNLWLIFALLTVVNWGLYGIFLHNGKGAMDDSINGSYKAFFIVGIAYLIVAVIGSAIMMKVNGSNWVFPAKGLWWSLIAGTVGAIGAFFVLLAFGAKGTPPVVMSIVFAGAPIVNALVSFAMHPPSGVRWQFYAGILLAAIGGCMVTLYKPPPAKAHAPAAQHGTVEPGH